VLLYSIKSAWFQRLNLTYDKPLSSFAFRVILRHYSKVPWHAGMDCDAYQRQGLTSVPVSAQRSCFVAET
jgi:hypothetical protein